MIFANTPFRQEMQFLVLGLIYAFQSPVFNSLPFLYYRSELECKIDDQWEQCQESQICSEGYEFEYTNKKGMESITMDYGLVCEKRITEASMISIGFFGQFAAFFIAVFTEVPKNQKTKIIFVSLFIEGAILYSASLIKGSTIWIMVILFIWNFVYSYLYSQVFAFINDMYSPSIKEKSVNMLNIFWTSCALGYILYSQVDGNWVNHVAYFSGAVIWGLSVVFLLLKSPPSDPEPLFEPFKNVQQTSNVSDKQLAKEQQKNFIDDLIDKFKQLKENKKYLKNAVIFILTWSTFQISYSTPFIAFNTLGGNIQQNVLISVMFDVGGSFISFYLLSKYDCLRLLLNNLLIIGVLQTVSYFVSVDNYWLQLIVILSTKLSTRLGLTTCLTLLPFVLPYQFNQLVFNIANVIAILLSTLLPFYRVYMESNQISIFCGVGAMTIVILFIAMRFSTLDDENPQIKAARLSRDYKKKSSFAPMRRNSDVLIENILRKSSMIAPQAGLMMLDKQSAQQEKTYFQQNRITELEPIQE